MAKSTIDLIVKVATEVLSWAVKMFTDKSMEGGKGSNDGTGNSETK